MRLRARIARTAGFNLTCLAVVLVSLWLGGEVLAPLLVRHGFVTDTWDFYMNMR